ncbi:tetratricopeptide repeat protein [Hymenobacter oligotrophus]|uniref:tetratricopeptide repeat protein n=1 Tax=Hymenobacter oligotrophus TaxID=2319843 RepID=UPI001F090C70|nr:tetratricopeptide repeat protein [Hymenobacter oligotrophus]
MLLGARDQHLRALYRQAQLQRVDSVRALVQQHPQADAKRVVLLTHLASELTSYDVRAAGPVRREALRLASELRGADDLVAETLLDLADHHIALAEYPAARQRLQQSQETFAQLHDVGGVMRCLGRLARIADQQGHYADALSYCFRVMAMGKGGDERRFHTSSVIHVGSIYTRMGQYALAENYLLEALQVAREHNYPDRMNLALGELGELSRRQGRWATARRYYMQSIAVSRKAGEPSVVLAMELNLAEVSERLSLYPDALALGYATLRQAQASGQLLLIPRAQALLARTFLHLGRTDSALWYAQRSLYASQAVASAERLCDAYEVLAQTYAQHQDYAQAYKAYQHFEGVKDSLFGEEVNRRTMALQLGHEMQQKQAQIRLLMQERELERLRQQRQQALLAGATLLVALGAGAALWAYRRRQHSRELTLRSRIAADLHDDVGTLLSQISLQSGLLQEGLADALGQQQQLSQISDASRSAVRQLNDVVWSLDAHNDHLPNLLDRMRDYAHEVLGPAGLVVVFELPIALPSQRLPVLLRRNLYLIYKESLHNIIKHATGARQVTIRLECSPVNELTLEVLNDGDFGEVLEQADGHGHTRRSGHGLRNIQARAKAMGGRVTLGRAGTGFCVRVEVPLASGWKANRRISRLSK